MSITSMNAQLGPQAPCPFSAQGTTHGPGVAVALRALDFTCPRLAAPAAFINLQAGEKVPEPDDDDPELVYSRADPDTYADRRLLYENEPPKGSSRPVAVVWDSGVRLVCIPGQREGGCRG